MQANWAKDLLFKIIDLLPGSPFTGLEFTGFEDTLSYVNYFIDVQSMVVIAETWLICIAFFYLYKLVLKWSKAL